MNELFTRELDSDEEDEEYVPDAKELEEAEEKKVIKKEVSVSKIDDFWKKMNANKKGKEEISAEKKELDKEIEDAINKTKEVKQKAMETVHFAGQKFEYEKILTAEDEKRLKDKEKKKTHAGLDSVIESIEVKKNTNTYTKTKKDWDNYVEKKQISKELDYNRKDGYLGKKKWIDEANERVIENNKAHKKNKLN